MKPDYRNWVPKGMVFSLVALNIAVLVFFVLFGCLGKGIGEGTLRTVVTVVLAVGLVGSCKFTEWCIYAYRAFSYDGKRQLSRGIIEGTAEYVHLPAGGRALDVGCGSGALAIAVAKRNPEARVVGVDRWGKDYASFSLPLCERNAEAEGVKNVLFMKGDATHLEFPDESFDAVTSNYVYHNITGKDKQALLLETFRVLKKGGTFAIHDLMSFRRYGDMNAFVRKLKAMGYEKVELIDTTDGMFMTKREARHIMLGGSTLLTGIK